MFNGVVHCVQVDWHIFFTQVNMPSTVIRSFDYREDLAVLTITFVNNTQYQYFDVPKDIFTSFKSYREKGIFYNEHIKGKYRYMRIN